MKGGPLKGFLHTHVKHHEFVCANNQQFLLLAGGANLQSLRKSLHLLTHGSQVPLRSLPKQTELDCMVELP
jgi:Tfp pilus assembly protein PilO